MKEIRIYEDKEGLQIDVKELDPLEAMNFMLAGMVTALKQIKPVEKPSIIKPNLNQTSAVDKSKLN